MGPSRTADDGIKNCKKKSADMKVMPLISNLFSGLIRLRFRKVKYVQYETIIANHAVGTNRLILFLMNFCNSEKLVF